MLRASELDRQQPYQQLTAGCYRNAGERQGRGEGLTGCCECDFGKVSEYTGIRSGGRGGIRTHEGLAPLAVFKTAALDRSATLPANEIKHLARFLCYHIRQLAP